MYSGQSGYILIHSSGNRLNSYDIFEYSEGHDSFYSPMLVDLTKPRDKVSCYTTYRQHCLALLSTCPAKQRISNLNIKRHNEIF